jgi:hypothetical protein
VPPWEVPPSPPRLGSRAKAPRGDALETKPCIATTGDPHPSAPRSRSTPNLEAFRPLARARRSHPLVTGPRIGRERGHRTRTSPVVPRNYDTLLEIAREPWIPHLSRPGPRPLTTRLPLTSGFATGSMAPSHRSILPTLAGSGTPPTRRTRRDGRKRYIWYTYKGYSSSGGVWTRRGVSPCFSALEPELALCLGTARGAETTSLKKSLAGNRFHQQPLGSDDGGGGGSPRGPT